jgi:hypothetical protein
MPTKRTPAEPKPTYAEWRARCAALLEGQGISAGFVREKEWRWDAFPQLPAVS